MYKIKNITKEDIMFVDIKGKEIIIEAGSEIKNNFPAKFGYNKKLVISEEKAKEAKIEDKKLAEVN